jgi:hypothetical protein
MDFFLHLILVLLLVVSPIVVGMAIGYGLNDDAGPDGQ